MHESGNRPVGGETNRIAGGLALPHAHDEVSSEFDRVVPPGRA